MGKCKAAGCPEMALPLSQFCEKHGETGGRESTVWNGPPAPMDPAPRPHPAGRGPGSVQRKKAKKPMRKKPNRKTSKPKTVNRKKSKPKKAKKAVR